jgi:hypothetical protein
MNPLTRLASLALVAALMSACGGGGTDPGNPPASGDGPGPVQGPAPSPAPGPAPSPSPSPSPAPQPAVTAVGAALGPVAASKSIGPAGGRLDAPDYGLAVVVPPGAFDREHNVGLQPIENHAPGARGSAWRITPEGVVASKPITLEWRPTAAERNGAKHFRIATQGADGIWRSASATQDDEGIVRTTTTHFSDWSLVAGAQLRPGQAEVEVGGTREFSVVICGSGQGPAQPGEQVHYGCESTNSAVLNTGWSVNGTPDGNATLGSLSGPALDPSQRTYQAPAAVPAQNPVAISVNYTDFFDPQAKTETLVAHVSVVDPAAGCQWMSGVEALDMTVEQDYSWAGADDWVTASYEHTARVSGRLVRSLLTPYGSLWFEGSLDQGAIKARHFQRSLVTPESIEVTGEGAPLAPTTLPSVRVFLDLTTCRLLLNASAVMPALHWATGPDGAGAMDEYQHAGMSFTVSDYPVGGLRVLGQERLMPVVQTNSSTVDRAEVWGAHHDFGHAIGTARVRWTLTPR